MKSRKMMKNYETPKKACTKTQIFQFTRKEEGLSKPASALQINNKVVFNLIEDADIAKINPNICDTNSFSYWDIEINSVKGPYFRGDGGWGWGWAPWSIPVNLGSYFLNCFQGRWPKKNVNLVNSFIPFGSDSL